MGILEGTEFWRQTQVFSLQPKTVDFANFSERALKGITELLRRSKPQSRLGI